jgi:hypothetical protein
MVVEGAVIYSLQYVIDAINCIYDISLTKCRMKLFILVTSVLFISSSHIASAQHFDDWKIDVDIQFRKLLTSDHVGASLGCRFKRGHELRYGVYYMLQDAVFWNNNLISIKTFRPKRYYEHISWSLSYLYNFKPFGNGSTLSLGVDMQQIRSHSHARAIQPFLGAGVFVESEIKQIFSLAETHLIMRGNFPLSNSLHFFAQVGLGFPLHAHNSTSLSLATQFVPDLTLDPDGLSYHLSVGLKMALLKRK